MKVKEIMSDKVEIVSPETTLKDAAHKMKQLDIGSLPVCDGRRLVGMLTDRDIAVRSTAQGDDPNAVQVKDAMTPKVAWCFDDQDIEEAVKIMESKQLRRLPVINHSKMLSGIISLGDISVRGIGPLACQALKEISKP